MAHGDFGGRFCSAKFQGAQTSTKIKALPPKIGHQITIADMDVKILGNFQQKCFSDNRF